jgi:c-di-GMP-binding flagellar brake protein YcgR
MQMQQFLEALHSYRATSTDILMVLAGLAALIVYLIFRRRWERAMELHARKRQSRAAFLAACTQRNLLKDEIMLLARGQGAFNPDLALGLVQSNANFDNFCRDQLARAVEDQVMRLNAVLTGIRTKLGFRPPPRGLPLVSTRELPAGQRLYLVFPTEQFLEVTVIEVDETKVVVTVNGIIPPRLPLISGSPVMIHFDRVGDARYSGTAYILKTGADTDNIYLTLNHAESLRRDQRRQDFRIDEHRSIYLWIVDESEGGDALGEIEERIPERVTLDDLSGGGASVIYKRELPINQRLYLNLDPTKSYGLPLVKGSVVRAVRRSGLAAWAVSVRFEDLRPSERQAIVRYVFLQEREFMQTD